MRKAGYAAHPSDGCQRAPALIQNVTHLLRARRFLPLFSTQFLGAFNDSLFKQAVVLFVTYQLYSNPARSSSSAPSRRACSSFPSSSFRRCQDSSRTTMTRRG